MCGTDVYKRQIQTGRAPWQAGFQRSHEHLVNAQSIRAVRCDDLIRIDDIAAGFAHLLIVLAQDHSLMEQLLERFLGPVSYTHLGRSFRFP